MKFIHVNSQIHDLIFCVRKINITKIQSHPNPHILLSTMLSTINKETNTKVYKCMVELISFCSETSNDDDDYEPTLYSILFTSFPFFWNASLRAVCCTAELYTACLW